MSYTPPILTVDAVIFQLINDVLHVLLIKRANDPFKGKYALPGGYNAAGETTSEALSRIMQKKTAIDLKSLGLVEQLYTFDTVARDPRGHAVSVTYMGLAYDMSIPNSSTSESPEFYPVDSLPPLAYDHAEIIAYAHQRLASKITYTNAVFALLPKKFTLTQLQTAYEAIFGRELDKRNFRKKYLALDLIKETSEMYKEGAHRPARLYQFASHKLQALTRSFD